MSIRIVSDSSCDLPEEIVSEYGIEIIPLYINLGDQSYRDGLDLTREDFYARLPTLSDQPTTSIPGLEIVQSVYRKLIAEGATAIVSIHIAGSLSNMVDTARKAAESIRKIPVQVVDSGQISLGIGLQALAAAKNARLGKSFQEIVALCESIRKRTWSFAALDTLDFIHRGGRISSMQYNLGRVLNIKPLLIMHDGVIKFEKVFTLRNSIKRVISVLEGIKPFDEIAYLHTAARDRLNDFIHQTEDFIPPMTQPLIGEVAPVIGAHVGPGGIGLVAIKKEG